MRIKLEYFIFPLVLWSCGAPKQVAVLPLVIEERDKDSIPKPKPQKIDLYEEGFENIFGRELDEAANLSWHIRKLINNHKQAKNINAFDEVPNSTWFTNRHAKKPMSRAELKRGPNRGTGPVMEDSLTIVGAKVMGVSPGFRLKDRRGDLYFIKFDIKGFPQLNTSAEIMTTKFVYAAGYNTPENYLCRLDPKKLRIAKGVTALNRWGREAPMTFEFVQTILDKCEPNPDGTYRVVASKALPGEPLGPFSFAGVRKDDPNDRIPHHHRRELRGYKVIAAWLNNPDAKGTNTLDVYVTENENHFVRHCLLDFGTSLGSSGYGAAGPARGRRGAFDLGNMFKKIITLGLWVEPWEKENDILSPSVGYFSAKLFQPGDFAFIIPNPAFQKATERDGFWGAKIVMSFSDQDIRTIVETAEYENSEDEEYIIETLIRRRDKTGRYWYGKVNPLDDFEFSANPDNHLGLRFRDLAVAAGFEEHTNTAYRYLLEHRGKPLTGYFRSQDQPFLELNPAILRKIAEKISEQQNYGFTNNIFSFKIQTRRRERGKWSKHLKVYFHYHGDRKKLPEIVAIEREN